MLSLEKNSKTWLILGFFVFLLASISIASAHQPRLVIGDNATMGNPIVILNPEVSQAFYGELQGLPNYYIGLSWLADVTGFLALIGVLGLAAIRYIMRPESAR